MDRAEIVYDTRYPIDDPARVTWNPSFGGAEIVPTELPPVDVSRLPGAEVVASLGWRGADLEARIGCVRAPSDRWAPGIEDVLFEKATWLAMRSFAMEGVPLRATDGPPARRDVISRAYVGERNERTVHLAHALGFVGAERDVLLCTVGCIGAHSPCGSIVASMAVTGQLETQPEPHVALRIGFAAIEHPRASLIVGFALLLLGSAVVLRRRSRVRLA